MTTSTVKSWFGKKGFSLRSMRELFMTKKDVEAAAAVPVRVAINLCAGASPVLKRGVQEAFLSKNETGLLHVADVVPGARLRINPAADFALILAPDDIERTSAAVQAAVAWAAAGVPVAVLGTSQSVLVDIETQASLALDKRGTFSESNAFVLKTFCGTSLDATACLKRLATWMVDTSHKTIALGANWEFLRGAACKKAIMSAALANVAVGGINIIPGADFPLMAINQVQMAMKIATMYGYEISFERIPEALFIMLSGLMMRGVAKGLTAPIKHGKFIIKGALGFAGTWATGEALVQRFERGQTIDAILDDLGSNSKMVLEKASDTVMTKFGELVGGLLEVEPGAVYKVH